MIATGFLTSAAEAREWLWIPSGQLLLDLARLQGRACECATESDRQRYRRRLCLELRCAEATGKLQDLYLLSHFSAHAKDDGVFLRVAGPFQASLFAWLWGLTESDPMSVNPGFPRRLFEWPGAFPPLCTGAAELAALFARVVAWVGPVAAARIPLLLWSEKETVSRYDDGFL